MLRRRWPLASKVLMTIAVVLGALAFVAVRGYQDRVEALRPAVGPAVPVAVAAVDLGRGTSLSAGMLQTSSVPATFVPPGAVHDPTFVEGRVLTADISAGEILTRSRLAPPRTGPLAALVPDGLRAIVVTTDLPTGTVRAGDRVEVFATYGGGRAHTELVGSGLEVLRVLTAPGGSGGVAGAGAASAGGIDLVLLVDSRTAERLAFARTFAQLQITILGPAAATG
jgi:pilus assembly protein CpaB